MGITDIKNWNDKDLFINQCFERFGSMNKNDYEVELMHLFLLNGNEDKSDNAISVQLRIPVSKVKRLRYEVDLRYPKSNDYYKEAFYQKLKSTTFKRDGRFILFSISNKALREFLNEKLESMGSFFDKTLTSNIVKITATDLALLLSMFEDKKELTKEIVNSIEKQDKEIDASLEKKCLDFLKGVTKKVAGDAGSSIINAAIDYFSKSQ